MEFRPCIDIHNGLVKQIVGSSLSDKKGAGETNFVSNENPAYYAELYKQNNFKGGHVIILNSVGTQEYELSKKAALEALKAYPKGLQIGGGITDENGKEFIEAGAGHVIVTSYLFENGDLCIPKMKNLTLTLGKEHVVFDLSCRKFEDGYHVMCDRWQTKTDRLLDGKLLRDLEMYCDEYLIHAVDVEGKKNGVESELIEMLSYYNGNAVTYAGGIKDIDDIDVIYNKGKGRINFTIGSSLDIFGGNISLEAVKEKIASL